VVHPQPLSRQAETAEAGEWSKLLRQLVHAQDLQLLEPEPGSAATAQQLLIERLRPFLQP
jgi:hypothetical protein